MYEEGAWRAGGMEIGKLENTFWVQIQLLRSCDRQSPGGSSGDLIAPLWSQVWSFWSRELLLTRWGLARFVIQPVLALPESLKNTDSSCPWSSGWVFVFIGSMKRAVHLLKKYVFFVSYRLSILLRECSDAHTLQLSAMSHYSRQSERRYLCTQWLQSFVKSVVRAGLCIEICI